MINIGSLSIFDSEEASFDLNAQKKQSFSKFLDTNTIPHISKKILFHTFRRKSY